MLLFQKRFHAGLVDGSVRLTFRVWDKARVKPGGRYRCHPIGVLEVTGLQKLAWRDVTEQDAQHAGFQNRTELKAYLNERVENPIRAGTSLFRVELSHVGDGDRVAIATQSSMSGDEREAVRRTLQAFDESDPEGPWTKQTLALIAANPRTAARLLAQRLGRETPPFKAKVVKLKKLGLTQSFEVGYELSPRGQAYLSEIKGTGYFICQ